MSAAESLCVYIVDVSVSAVIISPEQNKDGCFVCSCNNFFGPVRDFAG